MIFLHRTDSNSNIPPITTVTQYKVYSIYSLEQESQSESSINILSDIFSSASMNSFVCEESSDEDGTESYSEKIGRNLDQIIVKGQELKIINEREEEEEERKCCEGSSSESSTKADLVAMESYKKSISDQAIEEVQKKDLAKKVRRIKKVNCSFYSLKACIWPIKNCRKEKGFSKKDEDPKKQIPKDLEINSLPLEGLRKNENHLKVKKLKKEISFKINEVKVEKGVPTEELPTVSKCEIF